jgi:carbon starvation protein CstA
MSNRKIIQSRNKELRRRFSMVGQLNVIYQLLGFAVSVAAIVVYTFLTCTQVIAQTAYIWFIPLAWITWLTLCAGALTIQFFFRTPALRQAPPHRTGHESRNGDLYRHRLP